MWFTRISLKNPVFATMVMLAIVVLGAFSYQRLQVDQFPSIDFPVVVVTTEYPGASPEVVESEVTKKIEDAIRREHAQKGFAGRFGTTASQMRSPSDRGSSLNATSPSAR